MHPRGKFPSSRPARRHQQARYSARARGAPPQRGPWARLPRALPSSFSLGARFRRPTAGLPACQARPASWARCRGIQEGTVTAPPHPRRRAVPGTPRTAPLPPHPAPSATRAPLRQASTGGRSRPSAPSVPSAPHSPIPRGRRAAPSSKTPSSATVTPQLRLAMAPGRLGLGGESDCGPWCRVAAAGPRAWHPRRCAPPRLAHLRAGRTRPGSAQRRGSTSWPAQSPPPCPPPLPASTPASRLEHCDRQPPSRGLAAVPLMTFSTGAKVSLGEDTCPPFTVWETKEATVQPFFRGNQVCGTPKPWLPPLLPDLGCRLWTFKADATGTLFRMMSPQPTPGTSWTVFLMLTVTLPQNR